MKAAGPRGAMRRRFYGSISFTVLLFNILLVFLPVAAIFFLDTYEKQRLRDLEQHLAEQARLMAVALETGGGGHAPLGAGTAQALLAALGQNHFSRIRIFDRAGSLLGDSASLVVADDDAAPDGNVSATYGRVEPAAASSRADPYNSLLYRIGSWPVRALRQLLGAPAAAGNGHDLYDDRLVFADAPEIASALAGRYGAMTRIISSGGGRQVVLYSTMPVHAAEDPGSVAGIVLVSQSTLRILADLYETRLDIFRIFLWSAGVALALSLVLGLVLTRPLHRLSRQASQLLDSRGRLQGQFVPVRAHNEIGMLSASLADMSAKLERYTGFMESFSQDLAHEIRNPLASVRVTLDLLAGREADPVRAGFIQSAQADLARINTLIASVRELGRIDTEPDHDASEAIDASALLAEACRSAASRFPDRSIDLAESGGPFWLAGIEAGRFRQVVENLLDNALSFAPRGTEVTVRAGAGEESPGVYRLSVRDRGPGFPPEDAGRLFERFYSSRKQEDQHTGLGLAIVKSLAERWGGRVWAQNASPGASFFLELPALVDQPG